jgi:hypothetical protein
MSIFSSQKLCQDERLRYGVRRGGLHQGALPHRQGPDRQHCLQSALPRHLRHTLRLLHHSDGEQLDR